MASPALQVNCLRDSAAMNIRFESRGVAEREGELDERDVEREREKKMKSGEKVLTWFSRPSLFSPFCLSFLFP